MKRFRLSLLALTAVLVVSLALLACGSGGRKGTTGTGQAPIVGDGDGDGGDPVGDGDGDGGDPVGDGDGDGDDSGFPPATHRTGIDAIDDVCCVCGNLEQYLNPQGNAVHGGYISCVTHAAQAQICAKFLIDNELEVALDPEATVADQLLVGEDKLLTDVVVNDADEVVCKIAVIEEVDEEEVERDACDVIEELIEEELAKAEVDQDADFLAAAEAALAAKSAVVSDAAENEDCTRE